MQTSVIQKTMSLWETRDKSLSYLLNLWDSTTGGFRFASHQPPTLMATAYCILGLEFIGGLESISKKQKSAIISFVMDKVQIDGSFVDPLFRMEDALSQEHNLAYFQEETTTMCQQALDALSASPPPLRQWDKDYRTAKGIIHYLESLPWDNPWRDSNPVMFVLSQLCHDAERHEQPELLKIVDTALDWLDEHQSSETGLWKGSHEVSLTNAMAATFHFTFYYGYRNRPLQYVERIIDSCLALQEHHGLFSGNAVGQTCLDYDAIDLIAKASLVTDYRTEDVQKAMTQASSTLLTLYNDLDGGFADCKTMSYPRSGRKAKLVRRLGLSKLVPPIQVAAKGQYNVCWKFLSCQPHHSNALSTWFRLLALHLCQQYYWLEDSNHQTFKFRRLPFLGYHDPQAIKLAYSLTPPVN